MFGLSARYTVALMAMMGFIISFGMKCNLSAAKSEREKSYNRTVHEHPVSSHPFSFSNLSIRTNLIVIEKSITDTGL